MGMSKAKAESITVESQNAMWVIGIESTTAILKNTVKNLHLLQLSNII